jgi:hypothetical protein
LFVEFIMNHDHDHAAMVASSTTPLMQHDHPIETSTISSVPGLHMMMMAVSISLSYYYPKCEFC